MLYSFLHPSSTPSRTDAYPLGFLELFWPIPLLFVGITGIQQPLLVGIALFLAMIPWGLRLISIKRLTQSDFFIGAGWLLLTGCAAISAWLSYNPGLSWPVVLTIMGATGLFYAVINSTASYWSIVKLLVGITALMALYFITQYGYFGYWTETGILARTARQGRRIFPNIVFFSPHVNAVASFTIGPLLLSVALIYRARGWSRIWWIGIAGLITLALLLTDSRGSWLGLLVAFIIWAILLMKERSLQWIAAVSLIASTVISFYFLLQLPPEHRPGFLNGLVETYTSRFSLYHNSLYLILDYPFTGIGLGETFAMVYSKYQLLIQVPFLTYAHNIFLTIGLGLGLPGLIALCWILVSYYGFVAHVLTAKKLRHRRDRVLFTAVWLATTAIFIHGITDSPQFSNGLWTLPALVIIMGLTITVGRPALANSEVKDRMWQSPRPYIVAGAVIVLLVLAGMVYRTSLMGVWYANLGSLFHTYSDLSENLQGDETRQQAIQYYQRALSFDPNQAVPNRRLGLMALEAEQFEQAVAFLESAYQVQPGNQSTIKALGYAYLWSGQLDKSETLLQQRDDLPEITEELAQYSWWWGTQNRPDLATYAAAMEQRLSSDR
jgi:putative inorganic carbon (HCO3(-)) transporter